MKMFFFLELSSKMFKIDQKIRQNAFSRRQYSSQLSRKYPNRKEDEKEKNFKTFGQIVGKEQHPPYPCYPDFFEKAKYFKMPLYRY